MKIEKDMPVTRKVVVAYQCDRCGKVEEKAEGWATLAHRHSEWGNDSCDSFERFDLCSPSCYLLQLRESARELAGYKTAEIDEKSRDFVVALLDYLVSPEGPGYQAGAGAMRLNYEP